MTISVQKFDGRVYVVIGQHAMFLTETQARELLERVGRVLDAPKNGN